MSVDVILGLQRGDEGKGRFVDLLAEYHDIIARFNGGPNAGHTIANEEGLELRLRQVPSGISRQGKLNIIGNGTLLNPITLLEEVAEIKAADLEVSPKNLAISDAAHLILPHHIVLDEQREATDAQQGSTKRGIAFAAADKYARSGVRAELLKHAPDQLLEHVKKGLESVGEKNAEAKAKSWLTEAQKITPYITDTVHLLHQRLEAGDKVLAEGAQALGIDIEHGMYPFVTSSHTTTGGALNGLGIGPQYLDKVSGVIKAVKSHVGGGPLVTEIEDEKLAAQIRGEKGAIDSEYGSVTRRPRRIGYLDLPELRRAIRVNGVTEAMLTKLDSIQRYGKTMKVATKYKINGKEINEAPSSAMKLEQCEPVYEEVELWPEDISSVKNYQDLPANAKKFVNFLEEELGIPIKMIGVGPRRGQVIIR